MAQGTEDLRPTSSFRQWHSCLPVLIVRMFVGTGVSQNKIQSCDRCKSFSANVIDLLQTWVRDSTAIDAIPSCQDDYRLGKTKPLGSRTNKFPPNRKSQ
eukprot:5173013-Amphidinium_carterae.1